MTTPDIRVRLSAEGVAEVVAALKKIQGEAASTSAKGSKSFGMMNSALGGLKGMLAGLGVAFSVHAMANWIGQAINAADRMGELSQQVGASVENFSSLTAESMKFGIGTDAMAGSLDKFNRYLQQVREGAPDAVSLLGDMGLSAKAFDGKDAVEGLELIAGGMNELETQSKKTDAAITIFGKGGARLIPLLQSIADQGFERIKEKAKAAGVVLTDLDVQTVSKLADDLDILKQQATVLGVSFASGMAPQVSQALAMITGNMGDAKQMFNDFGAAVGFVAKALALLAIPIDYVATTLQELWIMTSSGVRQWRMVLAGNLKGAAEEAARSAEKIDKLETQMEARIKARWQLMKTPPPTAEVQAATYGGLDPFEETDKIRRARLAAAKQEAEALLALQKTYIKARENSDKRAYEGNVISLREWYEARRKAIKEGFEAEVAALAAARREASEIEDPATRAAALDALAKKELQLVADRDDAIKQSYFEQYKAEQDLQKARSDAEAKISAARGDSHAQRMAEIEEEANAYWKVLDNLGIPDAERDAAVARFREALTASAEFERQLTDAQHALDDLYAERSRIEADVDAGNQTQLQGERALLELEKQRQPIIKKMADDLIAAAEATGNPETIAKAREFANAVASAAPAIKSVHTYMVQLADEIEQSAIRRLADWFAEGISEAGGLRSMLQGLISDIRRLASEILAAKVVGWFSGMSLFGGGGGGGGGGSLGDFSEGEGLLAAGGGLVRGPGTGTSDSIPAWVSNKEYIMPADVVERPGMLTHLEELRRGLSSVVLRPIGSLRHFAGGGLVSDMGGAGKSGSLLIGLEQGLVLKAMESPEGQDLIVRSMAKHRRSVQRLAAR